MTTKKVRPKAVIMMDPITDAVAKGTEAVKAFGASVADAAKAVDTFGKVMAEADERPRFGPHSCPRCGLRGRQMNIKPPRIRNPRRLQKPAVRLPYVCMVYDDSCGCVWYSTAAVCSPFKLTKTQRRTQMQRELSRVRALAGVKS